jgi:hypothetical protein
MENRITNPLQQISHSFKNIRKLYNNLFLVPEDQEQVLADTPMMMDQVSDTIAFAIQNHALVRMQINLKKSVIEIDGHLSITRSGRLCITEKGSDLTQTLEDETIRSIDLI